MPPTEAEVSGAPAPPQGSWVSGPLELGEPLPEGGPGGADEAYKARPEDVGWSNTDVTPAMEVARRANEQLMEMMPGFAKFNAERMPNPVVPGMPSLNPGSYTARPGTVPLPHHRYFFRVADEAPYYRHYDAFNSWESSMDDPDTCRRHYYVQTENAPIADPEKMQALFSSIPSGAMVDLEVLAEKITEMRPRTAYDYRPLLVLSQGILKDIVSERIQLVLPELEELRHEMMRRVAEATQALKEENAQYRATIEQLRKQLADERNHRLLEQVTSMMHRTNERSKEREVEETKAQLRATERRAIVEKKKIERQASLVVAPPPPPPPQDDTALFEELHALRAKVAALEDQAMADKKDRAGLAARLREAQAEIKELREREAELAQVYNRLRAAEAEVKRLEAELAAMSAGREEAEAALAHARAEHDKITTELDKKVGYLSAREAELMGDLKNVKKLLELELEKVARRDEEIERRKKEIAEEQFVGARLRGEKAELERELAALREQLAQQAAEMEKLRSQVAEYEAGIAELKRQISGDVDLGLELDELRFKAKNMTEELAALRARLAALEREVEELTARIGIVEGERDRLHGEMLEYKKKAGDLELQLAGAGADGEKGQVREGDLRAKIAALEAQVKARTEDLATCKSSHRVEVTGMKMEWSEEVRLLKDEVERLLRLNQEAAAALATSELQNRKMAAELRTMRGTLSESELAASRAAADAENAAAARAAAERGEAPPAPPAPRAPRAPPVVPAGARGAGEAGEVGEAGDSEELARLLEIISILERRLLGMRRVEGDTCRVVVGGDGKCPMCPHCKGGSPDGGPRASTSRAAEAKDATAFDLRVPEDGHYAVEVLYSSAEAEACFVDVYIGDRLVELRREVPSTSDLTTVATIEVPPQYFHAGVATVVLVPSRGSKEGQRVLMDHVALAPFIEAPKPSTIDVKVPKAGEYDVTLNFEYENESELPLLVDLYFGKERVARSFKLPPSLDSKQASIKITVDGMRHFEEGDLGITIVPVGVEGVYEPPPSPTHSRSPSPSRAGAAEAAGADAGEAGAGGAGGADCGGEAPGAGEAASAEDAAGAGGAGVSRPPSRPSASQSEKPRLAAPSEYGLLERTRTPPTLPGAPPARPSSPGIFDSPEAIFARAAASLKISGADLTAAPTVEAAAPEVAGAFDEVATKGATAKIDMRPRFALPDFSEDSEVLEEMQMQMQMPGRGSRRPSPERGTPRRPAEGRPGGSGHRPARELVAGGGRAPSRGGAPSVGFADDASEAEKGGGIGEGFEASDEWQQIMERIHNASKQRVEVEADLITPEMAKDLYELKQYRNPVAAVVYLLSAVMATLDPHKYDGIEVPMHPEMAKRLWVLVRKEIIVTPGRQSGKSTLDRMRKFSIEHSPKDLASASMQIKAVMEIVSEKDAAKISPCAVLLRGWLDVVGEIFRLVNMRNILMMMGKGPGGKSQKAQAPPQEGGTLLAGTHSATNLPLP